MSYHENDLSASIHVHELDIDTPGRGTPLHLRVTVPEGPGRVPVIIFSHGFALSSSSYRPLADPWAASGFAVIQPTHLDSAALGLAADDPRTPSIWRYRETDLTAILDSFETIERAVPALAGRLDRGKIAVAGHSWGATSASVLLGATHPDPADGTTVRRADPRVKAGILLALAGTGGANLTPFAAQAFPFMSPDFSAMSAPALIVAGDRDRSALSVVGPEWWREGFDLSPGGKVLFTAFGAQHSLGGIHETGAPDTPDESPERVDAIRRLAVAFLRREFSLGNSGWDGTVTAITTGPHPLGRIEVK